MSTPPPPAHPDASPLGKPVAYAEHYDPSLLFPILRQGKRDELGLAAGTLPFVGEDVWNAYELSWLNPRGKPEVAVARFVFPADSPCLVESKSLKLYLNAFNQTPMESADALAARLAADLSAAAGAPVHSQPGTARSKSPLAARPSSKRQGARPNGSWPRSLAPPVSNRPWPPSDAVPSSVWRTKKPWSVPAP